MKIQKILIISAVIALGLLTVAYFQTQPVIADHPAGSTLCTNGLFVGPGYPQNECSDFTGNVTAASSAEVDICHELDGVDARRDCIRDTLTPGAGTEAELNNPQTRDNCPEDFFETSIELSGESTCVPIDEGTNIETNPIVGLIRTIVQFLSIGVGVAVTISIVVAGIQYISSQGNPQSLQAAQGRLINAIIALVLFMFMTAIINFLVPGGVF